MTLFTSGLSFGVAQADPVDRPDGWHEIAPGGFCGTVGYAHPPEVTRAPRRVSNVLYVNRCTGNCNITVGSTHDAPNNRSAIRGQTAGDLLTIPEFRNYNNELGTAADEQWNAVLSCVKETMSYYNVTVTDQRPASGPFHMAVAAGSTEDIRVQGASDGLLGISDVDAPSCNAIENVISFSLANEHRPLAGSAALYVRDLCKTIVHEAGHAYGLTHAFAWLDDQTSACADPMSYDTVTCNPNPAYFRNRIASCGEFDQRPCECTVPNNAHAKLDAVFGPGQPTVPPPTVAITTPASGSLANLVAANVGSKRGVARVEFYLNGWKWDTKPGVAFARGGNQPNPAAYAFQLPSRVPNGVYDIEVRGYDDLDVMTSVTATATKGAACTSADTCLAGQKCEDGKCFWDEPSGVLGDECTYDEFCIDGMCAGTEERKICTKTCIVGGTGACPEGSGLECLATSATQGICYAEPEEGGCCSVQDDSGMPWAHAFVSLGLIGFVVRRRRR